MIWREHRTLLIVLGALLAANAIFFFTYRVQYEARLHALDTRLQQAEDDLQRARNKRLLAEQQLASYNHVQADLENLYNRTWSTKPQRLTTLINELKRMGWTGKPGRSAEGSSSASSRSMRSRRRRAHACPKIPWPLRSARPDRALQRRRRPASESSTRNGSTRRAGATRASGISSRTR